ncbi:MAG: SDR family NAD(P)-dependent oxidoreductase, partial [Janthinobacterium lividum]
MATKTTTAPVATPLRVGRLAGKVALVTGAAGNLGGEIARHYLNEGATVVFTGRTQARIDAAAAAARADTGADDSATSTIVMDGADAASCRAGIAEILARHGRIDILVNNAGSAGPKQPLERLPLSRADLEVLQVEGATDTETVGDAARNILGVAWNMVRAAAGAMAEGGSIINVSTIFSRTHYYGRTAYTVPKAALNALSRELSLELGPRGIRVNLVFPGPIASERIRTVFAAMDTMRGDDAGTTANQFFDLTSFERSVEGAPRAKTFPTPRDIAMTCVFLGSDESAAFNGHDFEVTHGMTVRKESRSTYLSRPTMRSIDGGGLGIVVVAGTQVADAVAIARVHADCGADVLLGFIREVEAIEARRMLGDAARITVVQFDRADHDMMDRALDAFTESACAITGAVVLPAYGADHFTGTLADASDEAVDQFVDDELVGSIAVARTLSRYWKRHDSLVHDPRFIFMGNGSDGAGDIWTNFQRAMVEQLVRVWRDESEVDVSHGRRRQLEWGNQIVRFANTEPENLPFAAGQAARTLLKERKIHSVNLYLPPSIGDATGARKAMVGFSENITGLHLGKVALITGGSAGIGGQVARLLALAGAKVMIVARRES